MSKRTEQVNQLIHKTIDRFILRELDVPKGTILTIKQVETTPDCESAVVSVSILPDEKREGIFALLERYRPRLQKLLFKAVVMEKPPTLAFRLDTTEGVLQLLDKLNTNK
jgi:ribosome-binding factor A